MTIKKQVEQKFPVGSRFYTFDQDSMFTVEEIRDYELIAWMDFDAELRDTGREAYPTAYPLKYMLDPTRARTEAEWDEVEDKQAEWDKVQTENQKGRKGVA